MTSRSRKKPPTTVANLPATEADFDRLTPSRSVVVPIKLRDQRFTAAALTGLLTLTFAFYIAFPAAGQTVPHGSSWSPYRNSPRPSDATKPKAGTEISPLRQLTTPRRNPAVADLNGWTRPSSLPNTSSHLGWRSPQQTASDRLKAAKRAKFSAVTQDTPRPAGPTPSLAAPTLATPTLAKPVTATMHRDANIATVRFEEQSNVPRNLEMPVLSKPNQSIPTATGVRSASNASQAVPAGAIRLKAKTEPSAQRPMAQTTRARITTARQSTQQRKQTRASSLSAPRKLSPALRLQSSKSILKDREIQAAPVAEPEIQVVQNLRDLEMPLSDFLDEDLMGEAEDVLNNAPDAPSPEDFFDSRDASDTRVIQREQFKDETPLSNSGEQNQFDASPETRSIPNTLPVQADEGSRFGDPEPLLPQQPTFTPPPAIDQPSLDQPSVDQRSSGQPTFRQDPQPYPAFQPPAADSASNASASDRNATDDESETSLADELEKLEKLPPVPSADNAGSGAEALPTPGDSEKENPLKLPDDFESGEPDESARIGDLAATNGRDCAAAGEACEADFAYLKRRERTGFSLDTTPSIEPREFDMGKVEQVKHEKLAKAPSRTWMDHDGNVIADGSLVDFRDGRVFVQTVNGTIRAIEPHRLSNEDWCFVTSWWEIPAECRFETEKYNMRDFRLTTFTWTAAATCHKPLYFEQVGVERYGHSAGPIIQPVLSGAHFFGDIVMLPYHMGLNPPDECLYTLGHYRPGDCAPWLVPGFPFSTRAFKWEGLALGAAIALLP